MTPEEFFASREPAVREICLPLRARVLEVLPDAEEIVFEGWENVSYGTGESRADRDLICYVAPYRRHANLGFYRGALLPDPHGELRGTGALLRHLRFTSPGEVDADRVRAMLLRAREERWGPSRSVGE